MVAFGKKLKEKALPEWQSYYINYKDMKKKIKEYSRCYLPKDQHRSDALKEFSRILDCQIEKIVLFILEQQGLLASRLDKLGEKSLALQQQIDAPGVAELREAYRDVGHDLLKLMNYVELNAVGIRKILKKFDKRCGYKLTNYYVSTRANHPYSQLQQVFKHVGIGAVLGTLTHNLVGLQDSQGSCFSIYDQPSSHSLKEPVIDSIKAAMNRLTHSTNFLHFLGQHALIVLDDLTIPTSEIEEETYHFTSLMLNLANTFLYMVNTYIIVPTADSYAVNLGAAATVCGIIIGSMAVAQVFSSVYFSAWSNKSYFRPLVFSSIFLLIGNILYALAYDASSIVLLLVGRLLCGLGSARAVNRRYISDCVPIKIRMQASAGFVSASALGMACGPALAGILGANFKIYKLTFDETTLPGWLMAFAWLIYLILLWFLFKEPHHILEENDLSHEKVHGRTDNDKLEKGLGKPLLMNSSDAQENEVPPICEGSDTSLDEPQPASTIASAYRLLTPSVKVQLLIYFMLKYAMEILLSESSIITAHYFSWSTSSVAIFLACLGLTVLPVNVIVGTYISNLFQERQILLASEIMVFLGVLASFHFIGNYSPAQYICSAFITFVFAEVLEGVNLSLLSQVMSSRLARGTYNGGLLSTEAGTLARVVANGTITLAGYLWKKHLMNITLLPSLLICVASIGATFYTYNSLF